MIAHRWFGIVIGLHMALLCLAGSILIFGEDIDGWLNPEVRVTRGTGARIPVQSALEAYRTARPGVVIDRIYPPLTPTGTYKLRVGDKKRLKEAFVDPYSGAFLGERVRDDALLKKLADFHISLLLPKVGRNINGFTAIAGLWLIFSGLFVWWPRMRSQWRERMSLGRRAKGTKRLAKIHHLAGAYGFPVLAITMLTGVMWAFEDQSQATWRAAGSAPVFEKPKAKASSGAPMVSESRILAASEALAPGTHVVKFMLPTAKNRLAEIHREWEEGDGFGRRILVFVDAETAKVVAAEDSRRDNGLKNAEGLTRPLHRGLWAGIFSRVLYGIVGIFPLVLWVTGVAKFLGRRGKRRPSAVGGREEDAVAPAVTPERELVTVYRA